MGGEQIGAQASLNKSQVASGRAAGQLRASQRQGSMRGPSTQNKNNTGTQSETNGNFKFPDWDWKRLVPPVLRQESRRESENDAETAPTTDTDGAAVADEEPVVLSKSSRLKGYLFLLLFSIINLQAGVESDRRSFHAEKQAVKPSDGQRGYAMTVAIITILITGFVVIVHFDRFTCLKKYWIKAFRPGSKIELSLLIFLVIWWSVATWVNTTVIGIAGSGKGQYNLYFSTWVCCITTYWTVERWRTAAGQVSTHEFLKGFPNRCSSWAIAFVCNILCFMFVVDLARNVGAVAHDVPFLEALYATNPPHSYQWILASTVSCVSWILALFFIVLELFRKESKGDCEGITEGILLLILSVVWVPTVTIITVPGGVATNVGNTYFWTWAATFSVMRTYSHWVMDWREAIHNQIEVQLIEYEMAKEAVLQQASTEAADSDSGDEDIAIVWKTTRQSRAGTEDGNGDDEDDPDESDDDDKEEDGENEEYFDTNV